MMLEEYQTLLAEITTIQALKTQAAERGDTAEEKKQATLESKKTLEAYEFIKSI